MLSHRGLVDSFQSNIELCGKSMGFPWKSPTNFHGEYDCKNQPLDYGELEDGHGFDVIPRHPAVSILKMLCFMTG